MKRAISVVAGVVLYFMANAVASGNTSLFRAYAIVFTAYFVGVIACHILNN